VQGVGLSLLFVPLTTISMDPIPKEKTGNATSIFNFMRNLGGSVGIAMVSTMLERRRQVHTAYLSEHVTPYDQSTRTIERMLRDAAAAAGADPTRAGDQALGALSAMVRRQGALLSYIDLFTILGVAFLLLTPLILLMKRPARRPSPEAMAH
jgi:DHA2 family multidrug resistance protein